MIKLRGKTKVDLTGLKRLERRLKDLCIKEVEAGFYDDPHYSGLTTAQLMTIHEFGYGNLPQRNVMLSSMLAFKYDASKYIKQAYRSVVFKGQSAETALKLIGKKMEQGIKFTIDTSSFSNPIVSPQWAAEKGFDSAMEHYSDLKNSAKYQVVTSDYKPTFGRY